MKRLMIGSSNSPGSRCPLFRTISPFPKKGVIRGLHFQTLPYAQTKLVRALSGKILDVAVDLRKAQPTFGKFFQSSCLLKTASSSDPKGFAHGFSVLSETADVLYKIDEYYHRKLKQGSFARTRSWHRLDVPSGTELISERTFYCRLTMTP